jgi:hypothetical protein
VKINFISYKYHFVATKAQGKPLLNTQELNITKVETRERVHSYIIFGNKTDAQKYEKNGYLALSDRALNIARALENNDDFEKFVLEKREESHVAKNFTSEERIQRHIDNWRDTSPDQIIKNMSDSSFILYATQNYKVNAEVLQQIPSIIQFGCIFLPLLQPDIKILPDYKAGQANYDNININISSKVSVNQIIEYLENNKLKMEQAIAALNENYFRISDTAFKVLKMRKQKHPPKYKIIAAKIFKEEESVRRIHSDTNKKIASLFSHRTRQILRKK